MRVMVVEDNSSNLAVICQLVGRLEHVQCTGFADSLDALAALSESVWDLVIVDYLMPGMNGLELIQEMRATAMHTHVPVVMITADRDRALRLQAIAAGATDFLTKPVDPFELRARVTNLLDLRQAQNALARRSEDLQVRVDRATRHLQEREEEVVFRLARAIEFRDGETGQHIERVAQISQFIAEEMQQSEAFARTLALAAPLHDVGKIGVPDAILNKPGRLTDEEFDIMRTHAAIGAEILSGGSSDLVQMAAIVALGHHERWDGKGYPNGLAGDAIPLAARITAVADVFDALCSERPYKKAWPVNQARAEINRCAGSQFDPNCVAAFERAWGRIAPLTAAAKLQTAA
jgi:putative two-component system response regulator